MFDSESVSPKNRKIKSVFLQNPQKNFVYNDFMKIYLIFGDYSKGKPTSAKKSIARFLFFCA